MWYEEMCLQRGGNQSATEEGRQGQQRRALVAGSRRGVGKVVGEGRKTHVEGKEQEEGEMKRDCSG